MTSDKQRESPPIRRGVICIKNEHNQAKHNTALISTKNPTIIDRSQFSSQYQDNVMNHCHLFRHYVKYVVRVHLASSLKQVINVGTMFPISPIHFATAHHVTDSADLFYMTNADSCPIQRLLVTRDVFNLPNFERKDVLDIQDNAIQQLIKDDEDPVSRSTDDITFDNGKALEASFVKTKLIQEYESEKQGDIYFVPSPDMVHPGDVVASICHIGLGDTTSMQRVIDSTYRANPADAPSINDVVQKACHGGDSKLLAVGTVGQPPFHYNQDRQWVKNTNKPEEEDTSKYIVHDISLFSGCSGTFIIKLGDKARRFVGIHFSGSYYPHVNALLDPNDYTGGSITYNVALSVHHPAFVVAYAKHIVPSIPNSDLPLISEYLEKHKQLILCYVASTYQRLATALNW